MIINTMVTTVTQNTHFCPMLNLPIAGKLSSRFSITSDRRLLHSRSYGWILLSVPVAHRHRKEQHEHQYAEERMQDARPGASAQQRT